MNLTDAQRDALTRIKCAKGSQDLVGWRIAGSTVLMHLHNKGLIRNASDDWASYAYSAWTITPDGLDALEASA